MSEKIKRVLGQDDWLFYARTESGKLVYTVTEMSPHWSETPNKHGEDLSYEEYRKFYGTNKWRVDCTWMHLYIVHHPEEFTWEEVEEEFLTLHIKGKDYPWTEENDDKFVAHSRKHYLCD